LLGFHLGVEEVEVGIPLDHGFFIPNPAGGERLLRGGGGDGALLGEFDVLGHAV